MVDDEGMCVWQRRIDYVQKWEEDVCGREE